MTTTTHSLRLAGSAIAAALVLTSTPSVAQDAAAPFPDAPPGAPEPVPEPMIVVPDIPVPVAPEPTVVLPTELPDSPPSPAPSMQVPQPEAAPSPAAARARAATPAVERAAPAVAPSPQAAASPSAPADTAQLPPAATTEPVAEPLPPVADERPNDPVATSDNAGILALVLGGLAVLALAIWGFLAIGRRKPVRRYVAENTTPKPAPVAPRPVAIEPAVAPPALPFSPSFASRAGPVPGVLPHAGASVALPARVPESYAERDALMKRMIAAKPDRANPFTDRGARTRRARLILQSLGRDFGEAEPWIDLGQYPHNWPELARKQSAAA